MVLSDALGFVAIILGVAGVLLSWANFNPAWLAITVVAIPVYLFAVWLEGKALKQSAG